MSDIGQQLIDAVRQAANANPDYIYQKPNPDQYGHGVCYYVHDAQPSCIVGKAAWMLGIIDASFENHPENSAGVMDLAAALGLDLDDDEQAWLEEAQNGQDCGVPWFKAVANADAEIPLPVMV